jgi:hypothetical protein
VNIPSFIMLTEGRGYDVRMIEGRIATLQPFFNPGDAVQRETALDRMLALKRPLAIILDTSNDADTVRWLLEQGRGNSIYEGSGRMVWLITPSAPAVAPLAPAESGATTSAASDTPDVQGVGFSRSTGG